MREHYLGVSGRRRLVEALADQELVNHNMPIAQELADEVSLEDLQKGKQLYVQGERNNVLYFLLSGSIDLSIQDQPIATLTPGQCIGEFPILAPNLQYTVTAVAREQSVVASMPEAKLLLTASKHPEIWKHMARMLVNRLYRTSEPKPGPAPSGVIRPGDLTIGQIWRALTVTHFWAIITALFTLLAAVATASYKLGTVFR
jgi:CRP-like cAMP-binding protein